MPARSFRVIIQNSSSFLTLNQTFNHLCHGAWTGGWNPPNTIAPGDTGGLQSESDGFMTGTEGYVKYDVNAPGGYVVPNIEPGKQGMIYVYWDNPFYGTHLSKCTPLATMFPRIATILSLPVRTFGNTNSGLDFTASWNFYDVDGGGAEGPGDIVILAGSAYAFGPFSIAEAAVEVFGTAGIIPHSELDVTINDAVSAPPLFGQSLGPVVLRLLTQAKSKDW